MAKQTHEDRIKHLEGCQEHYDTAVDEIRSDMRYLTKSNNEMREVVFNGLRDRVKNIEMLVQQLAGSHPGRKQITIRRVLETAAYGAVFGAVILLAVLLVVGRLTADDIANILRAWKGDG